MGSTLGIGLSALLAAQKAIDVAGHNIANTNTPNYTRQRVEFTSIQSVKQTGQYTAYLPDLLRGNDQRRRDPKCCVMKKE